MTDPAGEARGAAHKPGSDRAFANDLLDGLAAALNPEEDAITSSLHHHLKQFYIDVVRPGGAAPGEGLAAIQQLPAELSDKLLINREIIMR